MDLHDLDVRIDRAGQKPSAINLAVAQLIDAGKLNQGDALAILTPLRELGGDLSDIQAWSSAAQGKPDAPGRGTLPPGMVVVDVGDTGDYSGPINAATLTLNNLAYIDRHEGSFSNQWGQVFNAKVRFPDQQGVLANADPDPLTPDGFDLSRYAFPTEKPV